MELFEEVSVSGSFGEPAVCLPVARKRFAVADGAFVDHDFAVDALFLELEVDQPPAGQDQQGIKASAKGGSLVIHIRFQGRAKHQVGTVIAEDPDPHRPGDGDFVVKGHFQKTAESFCRLE